MNQTANTQTPVESSQVTELRQLVTVLDAQLLELAAQPGTEECRTRAAGLQQSWRQLVKALDLGPLPRTRSCPSCGRTGMLEATRCGFCWTALPSVVAPSPSGI